MIDREEVKYIADLAHLKLTDSEIELFTEQLGEIIDYFEKLDELDTEEVVPTAYTIPMRNVMREDKVEDSLTREQVLKNAPDSQQGQFRVPRIVSDEQS